MFMQCVDEGPSEAQKRARAVQMSKFNEQIKKLEGMAKAGARIIHQDKTSVTFR